MGYRDRGGFLKLNTARHVTEQVVAPDFGSPREKWRRRMMLNSDGFTSNREDPDHGITLRCFGEERVGVEHTDGIAGALTQVFEHART